MKAAMPFASAACLSAELSQPVQAQPDWQANLNCASVLSYSSAAGEPTATSYAGSQVRTVYRTCNPTSACAVAPTCAPPVPRFRSLVINDMISVPETLMERRTVQEQQVRYEQQPGTVMVYKQVPRVVNVAETRMQQRTLIGDLAVPRNVVTPVTVVVQGFANRVGVRHVARNNLVTVNRVVTSQFTGTQSSPDLVPVQTNSAPS